MEAIYTTIFNSRSVPEIIPVALKVTTSVLLTLIEILFVLSPCRFNEFLDPCSQICLFPLLIILHGMSCNF